MTEDLGVSDLLLQIQSYIKSLEDENQLLRKNIASMKTENAKLLENERDMLKVSTIVNITNDNIKLKNYISILESQLQNRFATENEKRNKSFVNSKKKNEPITEIQTEHIEPITEIQTEHIEPITEIQTEHIEPIAEIQTEPFEPITENQTKPIEPITENKNDLDLNNSNNNNAIEPEKDNREKEESLYKIKYKGTYYLYNEQNEVYKYTNNEKGDYIGIRKYVKKSNKYKVVFQN